jgi:hypothetical protein
MYFKERKPAGVTSVKDDGFWVYTAGSGFQFLDLKKQF